ncbi:MAG TPA: sulfopyruvate decarboxylase subunit beta [Methanosarcinaceae archaeon]|nr:sulfopyruvate decarboxylase subunit beta [Methanosarcinaceae archaeon]
MRSPEDSVIEILQQNQIDIVATLPCDRIKNLLPLISRNFFEIPLTREENGLGICAGAYMAGGKPVMVIQSTGLGNMINALESLNITCNIPLPILASWRGVYKEGIEAQKPLGEHLPEILDSAGITYTIIDDPDKLYKLNHSIIYAYENLRPHIILFSPKVWEGSTCAAWDEMERITLEERSLDITFRSTILKPHMVRFDAIAAMVPLLNDEIVVANIGVPCKELYALCDRDLNYYMFGSMGLVSSIGLGIALRSGRRVIVLDGDGSLLMNPNALVEIARMDPSNLTIVALDNGAYGSTGSQETLSAKFLDLELLARGCGIENTVKVHTQEGIEKILSSALGADGVTFIHVLLKPGNTDSPNIPLTPAEVTERFMHALKH